MRDNVIIAYRGSTYELGQWPQGYGIWSAGTAQSQPDESWPPTPDGWSAAWHRFASLETPDTIVAVPQPGSLASQQAGTGTGQDRPTETLRPFVLPSGDTQDFAFQSYAAPGPSRTVLPEVLRSPLAAVGLLALGLTCGLIGLFPSYLSGTNLASQPDSLAPHVIYLAAWALSAVLIGIGGASRRIGALLGIGTSAVTFGLLFVDMAFAIADGAQAGAGLVLTLIGWVGCAAGSWLGLAAGRKAPGREAPGRGRWDRTILGAQISVAVTLIIAALGVAIAFAPPWDSYTLTAASGATRTFDLGNAFAYPGLVIFGNVATMVALVVAVTAAALRRPARAGWALAAGATIPMAAQAVSAIIQSAQPAATQLGSSPAAAARAGVTITSGLTAAFWVYLVFVVALAIAATWLAVQHPAAPTSQEAFPGAAGMATVVSQANSPESGEPAAD